MDTTERESSVPTGLAVVLVAVGVGSVLVLTGPVGLAVAETTGNQGDVGIEGAASTPGTVSSPWTASSPGTTSAPETVGSTAASIDGCTTIDSPGEYELASDIAGNETCLEITASDVLLDGQGQALDGLDYVTGVGVAINGTAVSNVTVANLTVGTFYNGVSVEQAAEVTLRNLTVTDSGADAVTLDGVANASVLDSNLSANRGSGLHAADATSALAIENSTIAANTVGGNAFSGLLVESSSAQVTIENNTIHQNPGEGIQVVNGVPGVAIRNNTISNNARAGVLVDASAGPVLADNVVTANERGIQLGSVPVPGVYTSADNATLTNNHISDSDTDGIAILGSDDVTVADTTVTNAGADGLHLEAAERTTVRDTTTRDSAVDGLRATDGLDLSIQNVTAVLNGDAGVSLDGVDNATVAEGELRDNERQGLYATDAATALRVLDNTVASNSEGGGGYTGLYVDFSSAQLDIENNTVETSGGGGIGVYGVSDATVRNNTATANGGPGIELDVGSDDATVADNVATGNQESGIYIAASDGVVVSDSNVSGNANGTVLAGSTDVTVRDTLATNNDDWGVVAANHATISTATNLTLGGGTSVNGSLHGLALRGAAISPSLPTDSARFGPFLNATNTTADGWLALDYDGDSLAVGQVESSMRLWRYDGAWTEAAGDTNAVDTASETVTANVTASGTFTLLADEVPVTNLSRDSHDFGDVHLDGPTASATVTVTNDGAAALNVTGAGITGPAASAFSTPPIIGNDTVQPGGSTDIPFEFAPSTRGEKNATLAIAHDAEGTWSNVSLSGRAVAPDVNVTTATPVDFGAVNVGDLSDELTLTLENNGTAPLDLPDATIDGPDAIALDFDAGGNPTPYLLRPDETVTAELEFQPLSTGEKTAFLEVAHNVSDRDVVNVTLGGTGVTPNVSVAPSAVDFGTVRLDETGERTVTVANNGGAPLAVSSSTVSGASAFALNGTTAPFVVGHGESTDLRVAFAPNASGPASATLTLEHNATNATGDAIDPVTVSLNATGVGPNASVAPATIDFGEVPVGEAATSTVVLSNEGNRPLDVTSTTLVGKNASAFAASNASFVVAAGDNETVSVSLDPDTMGTKMATLELAHNDSDASPTTVSLSGTAIAPVANLTPAPLEFGAVHVGTTATATATVTNDGTAPLAVSGIDVSGGNETAFLAPVVPDNTTIHPDSTATFAVEFSPDGRGLQQTTVTVSHNGSSSPSNVSVTGTAVAPNVNVTTTRPVAFGAVNVGNVSEMPVTIENNGTAPLDLPEASIQGPDTAVFDLVPGSDPTPAVLGPGQTATVELTLQPDSTGEKTAFLNVSTNVTDREEVNVTLLGDGIDTESPALTGATAVDANDSAVLVGRGDAVAVNVTVTDNVAVDTVTANASVLGNGTVELTDADDDDEYDRTIAVDAGNATDGTHVLSVSATDAAGNDATVATSELVVDTTNATLTITYPSDGAAVAVDDPRLNGTVGDATSGVAGVVVDYGDGNGWVPATEVAPGKWEGPAPSPLPDGEYTFAARATDDAGNVGPTVTATVTVDTTAPTADAGANQTVDEDTAVGFDASASTDNLDITGYEWDFDDGTTATGTTPTQTYADPGTYTATLTVSDAASNTDTDTVTVTVRDVTPPSADAGANQTVTAGTQVEFDGTASSDNGNLTGYEWALGDGTNATGPTPTQTYTARGTYTATLTVTDAADNTDTDTVTVTVESAPPDSVTVGTEPGDVTAGDSITGPPTATVTDAFGNPVAGVEVTVVANESGVLSGTTAATTNESGQAVFDDVWSDTAGSYRLTFDVTGVNSDATSEAFAVEPGSVANVTLSPVANQTVAPGDSVAFDATAFDTFGNVVEDDDGTFSWQNATENGTFEASETGRYAVTAEFEGVVSAPVTVTVQRAIAYNLTFEAQGIENGTVTVENVSAGGIEAAVLLTYDSGGQSSVPAGAAKAGPVLAGKTVGTVDGGAVPVTLADTGGFPGNHTAHLLPAEEVSNTTEVGAVISNSTLAAVGAASEAYVSVEVGDQPARDTTGDGLLDDVRGDGTVDIFDVQTLFANLDEPVVEEHAAVFDFQGSNADQVTVFDVQALFNAV